MAFRPERLIQAFSGAVTGGFRAWTYVADEPLEAVLEPGWLPFPKLVAGDLVWLAVDPPPGPEPRPARHRCLLMAETAGRNVMRLRVVLDLGVAG